MPSIDENKFWGENYHWSKHGDEWNDQAEFCNQPYTEWRNSIVENFIYPNINKESIVLEIAPGHGRWTKFIIKKAEKVILVDLNPKCIEYCRNKFYSFKNISYFVNDGKTLSFIENNSVDFIFSYDSFVHMEEDVIDAYFMEFNRILKKDGCAIIHHVNRKNSFLIFNFFKYFGKYGKKFYNKITLGKYDISAGWRSNISKEIIRKIARENKMAVEYQKDSWGKNNEYNVKCFNDCITKIYKK